MYSDSMLLLLGPRLGSGRVLVADQRKPIAVLCHLKTERDGSFVISDTVSFSAMVCACHTNYGTYVHCVDVTCGFPIGTRYESALLSTMSLPSTVKVLWPSWRTSRWFGDS